MSPHAPPPGGAGPPRRPEGPRITRRGLVVAMGGLALGAGGTALLLGREPAPSGPTTPPPAPSPPVPPGAGTDLAGVLREADAAAGVRLRSSAWEAWAAASPVTGPWDGLWVAWLLRGHGADPAATSAEDLLALVRSRGGTGATPSPGALAFYRRGPGADPLRVGLVTSTTGAVQTLEGDHPVPLPPAERFVRRFARPGPGLTTYGLPGYGS